MIDPSVYRLAGQEPFVGNPSHELHIYVRIFTRRQAQILKLLNDGYVAELVRPLPKRVSRRYIMRHPLAHEADGEYVTARTIERLTELGLVVKVVMPWSGKTWIFSRSRYEESPMGQGRFGSTSSTEKDSTPTSPPSTNPPTNL